MCFNYINDQNFEMFACFSEFFTDNNGIDIEKIKDITYISLPQKISKHILIHCLKYA